MKTTLDKSVVKKANAFTKHLNYILEMYIMYNEVYSVKDKELENIHNEFANSIVNFRDYIKKKQEKYVNNNRRKSQTH